MFEYIDIVVVGSVDSNGDWMTIISWMMFGVHRPDTHCGCRKVLACREGIRSWMGVLKEGLHESVGRGIVRRTLGVN
jgi:hypothetical protein